MVDIASNTLLHHQAHELLALIEALNQSGSSLEDHFWEQRLNRAILALFADEHSTVLEQLLDYLVLTDQAERYDLLVNSIEALAESHQLQHANADYEVLLVTAPIVAWTRYQLPEGHLSNPQHEQLLSLFKSYAGPKAKVALLGQLLSFDQLPKNYAQTHQLTAELAQLALADRPAIIELDHYDDGIHLLADTKYIVGVIAVPKGAAPFAWQTQAQPLAALERHQRRWLEHCEQILAPLFIGCQAQYLTPNGFYFNNRASDKLMRPLAIQAAVHWLAEVTQTETEAIKATIMRCGDQDIEEYRIGLSVEGYPDLLYGCVWPLFSLEEEDKSSAHYQDSLGQIQQLLNTMGVSSIVILAGLFEPLMCEECQVPYFPTTDAQLLHPHLPDGLKLHPEPLH